MGHVECFSCFGYVTHFRRFFLCGPPKFNKLFEWSCQFIFLCKSIGVPIKMEKTQASTTNIVIYETEVDSVNIECRLPVDKIQKIQDKLHLFKKCKKVMLHVTIICLLNFAFSVKVPGRTLLRRLINLTCGLTNPKFFIWLNKESRADLETWAMSLTIIMVNQYF